MDRKTMMETAGITVLSVGVGVPLYSAAVNTWGNSGRVAYLGGMVALSWGGFAYRRIRYGKPDPDPFVDA